MYFNISSFACSQPHWTNEYYVPFWVGLHDFLGKKQYNNIYNDASTCPGMFIDWISGQPDGGFDNGCIAFNIDSEKGSFQDDVCDSPLHGTLCETVSSKSYYICNEMGCRRDEVGGPPRPCSWCCWLCGFI